MARNVELKARIASRDAARQIAQQIATQQLGTFRQTDTYFHTSRGRLKLREMGQHVAQLIAYHRPDAATPRGSDYDIVPVSDPESLKQALAAVLGIRAVVEKTREVFLYQQVRIHLDEVSQLGEFLEFEAVLSPTVDDAAGEAQLRWLSEQFGIRPADIVPQSYVDLIERQNAPPRA